MSEIDFALEYNGQPFIGTDPWLPRIASLFFDTPPVVEGAEGEPLILSFDLATGEARLYAHFPFRAWVYVDDSPAAFVVFTDAVQTRHVKLPVSAGEAHRIEIRSELSGCPSYLGINEDERDLGLQAYNFRCTQGTLPDDEIAAAGNAMRHWQMETEKRRPCKHLPRGAVKVSPPAARMPGLWHPEHAFFATEVSRHFAIDLEVAAIRAATEAEGYAPSDVIVQISAFDENFLGNETAKIVLKVGDYTHPAMCLTVDAQQTVSACFVSLGLAQGDRLVIDVEIRGFDFERLKKRGNYGFEVVVFAVNRPLLLKDLESRTVWLFSQARSGTTWIGDICWAIDEVAVIDESCLPRMLGIPQLDPELFHVSNPSLWVDVPLSENIRKDDGETTADMVLGYHNSPAIQRQIIRNAHVRNNIWAPHSRDLLGSILIEAQLEQCLREYGVGWYKTLLIKCPNDGQIADFVSVWMPSSKLLLLTRDGRDVIRSRFSAFSSRVLNESRNADLRLYCIAWYAQAWNNQLDISSAAARLHDADRVMWAQYEDIRSDTEGFVVKLARYLERNLSEEACRKISEHTQLEKAPPGSRGGDKPRQNGKVGGYKSAFDTREIELMNTIMGRNLRQFGYAIQDAPESEPETAPMPARKSKSRAKAKPAPEAELDASVRDS